MHVWRASLRLLFRIARLEFGCECDPTLDLVLPPRTTLSTRPLTEEAKGARRQSMNLIGLALMVNGLAVYLHRKRLAARAESNSGSAEGPPPRR